MCFITHAAAGGVFVLTRFALSPSLSLRAQEVAHESQAVPQPAVDDIFAPEESLSPLAGGRSRAHRGGGGMMRGSRPTGGAGLALGGPAGALRASHRATLADGAGGRRHSRGAASGGGGGSPGGNAASDEEQSVGGFSDDLGGPGGAESDGGEFDEAEYADL